MTQLFYNTFYINVLYCYAIIIIDIVKVIVTIFVFTYTM